MTSKTFESIGNCMELSVGKVDHENLVGVEIRHTNGRWLGIASLAPSDAPALALAILEAAGYDDKADDMSQADAHAFNAMHKLQQSVDEQERITAEARERAELEAEAFNLYRAYMAVHEPLNAIGGWHMLAEHTKEKWLAVARRAREMRAEK